MFGAILGDAVAAPVATDIVSAFTDQLYTYLPLVVGALAIIASAMWVVRKLRRA